MTERKTERPLACSECGMRVSANVIDALGFAIGSEMGCGACGERSVCVMPKSDTAPTIGKWLPGDMPMWNGKTGRVVAGDSPSDVCMKLMDIVAAQDATLDAITETLACDRGDVAEAVRLLVTAHEACKREREVIARTWNDKTRVACLRAERAEAVLKAVRVRCAGPAFNGYAVGTTHQSLARNVLAILDGKEGAR